MPSNSNYLLDKSGLRKQLIHDRLNLDPEYCVQKSQQICNLLSTFKPFVEAKTIASFFSYKQEPNLISLVDDRRWLFPHCAPKRTLQWHPWQRGETLHKGRYGILEPLPPLVAIEPTTIDLIFVPAVACDRHKHRLGYGAGYYDRCLSQIPWGKVTTIGVVFEQFVLPQVPRDSWDQPLDYICTELALF